MKKIILFGAGGHCKSCIEIIENSSEYIIEYILDINPIKKKIHKKYKIINEKKFKTFKASVKFGFVTLGQIKSYLNRKEIFDKLEKNNFRIPTLISSNSYISKYSKINKGSIIMNFAYIGPSVKVGKNCIINNRALIEHDSTIKDHCHISTGAIVNGNVKVGSGTFIGSGVILKNGISIGKNCIIGAGSIIKTNIKDNSIIKEN